MHLLRDGRRRVYKNSLEELHPIDKDFLYRFSRDNPEVLAHYREAVKRHKRVSNEELDEEFDEVIFAETLIR